MRQFTSIFGTSILVLFILFLVACQTGSQTQHPSIEVVTATPRSTAITASSELVEEEPAEESKEEAEEEAEEEAAKTEAEEEAAETEAEEEETEEEAAETEAEAEADQKAHDANSSAYPAPSANPYPGPKPTEESTITSIDPSKPLDVPPPTDSTKANIGGTLLQQTSQGTPPFQGAVLYLGHIILDDNGEKKAAGFFEKNSPRTSTNSAGHFLFENVEPREYVLFFWTPQGSVMLLDPSSGQDMIFDLKAGDAINTGPLDYDLTY